MNTNCIIKVKGYSLKMFKHELLVSICDASCAEIIQNLDLNFTNNSQHEYTFFVSQKWWKTLKYNQILLLISICTSLVSPS